MKIIHKILFAAGLCAVVLSVIPGLILGQEAIVTYHDQLDGEMIAYILQARHLWQGGILPEFMGGMDKTALMMPAPACVLFFLPGNYAAALWWMKLLGSLVGFLGMYLLVRDVAKDPVAAVIAGTLYAWLPFLPVYGLSQFGLPMLCWCVMQLDKNRWKKISYCYTALYALNSSLVLVGFAVLSALAVFFVVRLAGAGRARDEAGKGCLSRLAAMGLEMTLIYLLINRSLIGQLLGFGQGVRSHKSEYLLAPEGFLEGWKEGFLYGGQHSGDHHAAFLGALLLSVLLGIWLWRKKSMAMLLAVNLGLAGISALWNCGAGVWVRERLGTLGAFQLDRFLWLCPCFWYLLLGCGIAGALKALKEEKKGSRVAGGVCCAALAVSLGITSFQILKDSEFKSNLQKLRDPDYPAISYADYYAVGVLEQVEDFLRDHSGREKKDYRVVSLGIDPAAALYHGFYCLDGYSNNYAAEYKHAFRRIIAPELEKSAYLRDYFDNWGNRCYLFSAECPGYYTIEKNGFYFQELSIDTGALREMGGAYLFSAAYIANADELGLRLLREEPFETAGSYYRIFLYGTDPIMGGSR